MPAPMATVIETRAVFKMIAFLRAMIGAALFGRMFLVMNGMRPVFKIVFTTMSGIRKFVMISGFFMMAPAFVIRVGIITVTGVISGI